VDPVTGKQRRISRQVQGSGRKAEKEATRLKAQVMDVRFRGARAKTLAELVDVYLEWREQNDKPIGPCTIQSYRALAEARIRPGLGKLRLHQVDPPTLDRFYMALRKSGGLRKRGSRCPRADSAWSQRRRLLVVVAEQRTSWSLSAAC
jgi:hypothetical protein